MPISILPQNHNGQKLFNAIISFFSYFWYRKALSQIQCSERKESFYAGYLQVQAM